MPVPYRFALLALLLTSPVSLPAAERDPVDPAAPPATLADADDPPGQTVFAPTRRALRDPFAVRVRELGARRDAALADLRARLASAAPAERNGIQREIEACKRAWEGELVGAQIERARATGRAALAARLERRLAVLREAEPSRVIAPAGGAR